DLEAARAMLTAGTISVAEIAKRLGVNRDTFYSYFPRARANSIAVKP
ncbi:TetR family transcriptional regulator, partial [Escherichia coli]|nr:TetR family transcriptional regulator [Escherichia coli]